MCAQRVLSMRSLQIVQLTLTFISQKDSKKTDTGFCISFGHPKSKTKRKRNQKPDNCAKKERKKAKKKIILVSTTCLFSEFMQITSNLHMLVMSLASVKSVFFLDDIQGICWGLFHEELSTCFRGI